MVVTVGSWCTRTELPAAGGAFGWRLVGVWLLVAVVALFLWVFVVVVVVASFRFLKIILLCVCVWGLTVLNLFLFSDDQHACQHALFFGGFILDNKCNT